MSRIGKLPINIPQGVDVNIDANNTVTVKGKLGVLTQPVHADIAITVENSVMTLAPKTEEKILNAKHGLYRSLLANMVKGVSEGFVIEMELVGVGYRASNQGQVLDLSLGYSHHIYFVLPDEIRLFTETAKGKNPFIKIESHDKQLLGQVAAKIRSMRAPEPYKGKGVRFKNEVVRRKAGKTSAK